VTGQEAVAPGQGTEMAVETEITGGAVAAEAEKGMDMIGRETIVVTAEAQAGVQALTIKTVVEQGMMISAEAGAEVGAAHTIVLHLLAAVLAPARAQHHAGAQHHTAGAQNHAAGAQNHAAGAQHHTAGAQNNTAGAQHHTTGVQNHTAGAKHHAAGVQHHPRAP
jgi:tRNA-binding EMAP/Myf-like protein